MKQKRTDRLNVPMTIGWTGKSNRRHFLKHLLETNNFKLMHPDNTVVCQVRISRAAMKAAQEAAKAEKGAKKKK